MTDKYRTGYTEHVLYGWIRPRTVPLHVCSKSCLGTLSSSLLLYRHLLSSSTGVLQPLSKFTSILGEAFHFLELTSQYTAPIPVLVFVFFLPCGFGFNTSFDLFSLHVLVTRPNDYTAFLLKLFPDVAFPIRSVLLVPLARLRNPVSFACSLLLISQAVSGFLFHTVKCV